MHHYKTRGTCSRQIDIELNGDRIERVTFVGGCTGSSQGLSVLVQGMAVNEVIERLKGIQCRAGTSCPDQLARALEQLRRETT